MVFTFKRDQKSIHTSTKIEIQVGPELTDWPTTYSVPDVAPPRSHRRQERPFRI
jgi:hypothetical protein